jgi:hypothetical protein
LGRWTCSLVSEQHAPRLQRHMLAFAEVPQVMAVGV